MSVETAGLCSVFGDQQCRKSAEISYYGNVIWARRKILRNRTIRLEYARQMLKCEYL